MSPKRAILYARVSTAHHDQKPENQIADLERYATAREWEIAERITDHGYSGGTDQRPGLQRLMTLARTRHVDVIVIAKLDRLFRSLRHMVATIDELQSLGVQLVSLGDQIDMGTPAGRLMVHLISAFGEFEKALIQERIISGLAHARARGQKLGRPKSANYEKIRQLRSEGLSYTAIAAKLGVSKGAVCRALRGTSKTP